MRFIGVALQIRLFFPPTAARSAVRVAKSHDNYSQRGGQGYPVSRYGTRMSRDPGYKSRDISFGQLSQG
jgi:hypothetical protein